MYGVDFVESEQHDRSPCFRKSDAVSGDHLHVKGPHRRKRSTTDLNDELTLTTMEGISSTPLIRTMWRTFDTGALGRELNKALKETTLAMLDQCASHVRPI